MDSYVLELLMDFGTEQGETSLNASNSSDRRCTKCRPIISQNPFGLSKLHLM
jgi:hypothetical protein